MGKKHRWKITVRSRCEHNRKSSYSLALALSKRLLLSSFMFSVERFSLRSLYVALSMSSA